MQVRFQNGIAPANSDLFASQHATEKGLIKTKSGLMVPGTTLFSGQWAGQHSAAANPRESMAKHAQRLGFDGVGPCTWAGQFNVIKAACDPGLAKAMLDDYALGGQLMRPTHIEGHIAGQMTLTPSEIIRLSPESYGGLAAEYSPLAEAITNGAWDDINEIALKYQIDLVQAAANAEVDTVIGFLGSNIWHLFYRFPDCGKDIDAGYKHAAKFIQPLLKKCADTGVAFALEVHPTEIAFDYQTLLRFVEELEAVDKTTAKMFKVNVDPSHFIKQGIDPAAVLRKLPVELLRRIHIKGAAYNLGRMASPQRNGNLDSALNSMLPYGDLNRGSDFKVAGDEIEATGIDWANFYEAIRQHEMLKFQTRELEFEVTSEDWDSAAGRSRYDINSYRRAINQQGKFDDWEKK